MANVKISDLPAIAALTKAAIVPATQDGVTGRTTAGTLLGTPGADGTILIARSAATYGVAYVSALRMVISGLIQSQAADTDHDTTISAGGAMNSTNAYWMTLASAITKRIDAAWAVGTNAGGLDGSESVDGTPDANTWYYIHLIAREDTGVVDVLYSESATAPTLPANYDYFRLIGAVLTDGSANIIAYDAYELAGGGLEILWDDPPLDVAVDNTLTTTARTDTLSVPTAFSVHVTINVHVFDAASNADVYISCPDVLDEAPSVSAAPLAQIRQVANTRAVGQVRVRTSATGTIRSRADLATVDEYDVSTTGFEWSRR